LQHTLQLIHVTSHLIAAPTKDLESIVLLAMRGQISPSSIRRAIALLAQINAILAIVLIRPALAHLMGETLAVWNAPKEVRIDPPEVVVGTEVEIAPPIALGHPRRHTLLGSLVHGQTPVCHISLRINTARCNLL